MSWKIHFVEANTILIQDGDRVVGSGMKSDDRWLIEIMWGGSTGDIKSDCADYGCALAFIEGVEKAFAAVTS